MAYSGIDAIQEKHIIRSIGKGEKISQLGFGFMHKPGHKIDEKNSVFSFLSVVYIIRGRGKYIDAHGNQYPLDAGSVFLRYPGISHSTTIDPNSNWSECYMDFGSFLYDLFINMNIIPIEQPVIIRKPDRTIEEQIYSNMIDLRDCDEHKLPDLLLKAIELLRTIHRDFPDAENNKGIFNIINKSCTDFAKDISLRIDLKQYCRENGCGYESFRKSFKSTIGLSPGKYIVRRRIDKAC